MKRLIGFILIVLTTWSHATPQSNNQTLNENFKILVDCYNWVDEKGNPLTPEDITPRKVKALRKIDDADSPIKKTYPIFIHLVTHMREALHNEAKPYAACKALKAAVDEVEELKKKGFAALKKLEDYNKIFGIDTAFIYNFYKSQYCQYYGIERGTECETVKSEFEKNEMQDEKKSKPVESVKPAIREVQPNNKDYKSENGCSMLREALAKDLLMREHLEISELPIGDARRIPGVKGAQYEVRFKREDNKKLLYFEPGWYIIPDRSQESPNNNFWDQYAKAVKEFKSFVLDILKDEDISEKSFQIFLQGSADAPIFTEKPLVRNYNTDFFQNIRLLEINQQRQEIAEAVVHIGDKYDNNELPNLRAAFLKYAMLQMEGMQRLGNHFHIFRGNVKPYEDKYKRSCYIILVVDWDAVEAKIKMNETIQQRSNK